MNPRLKEKGKRKTGKKDRQKASWFWLAAVSFLLFSVSLSSCHTANRKTESAKQSDEQGVAKFVVSEEIHNFGPLKAGEIVSYTFVFRNEGTKTLKITDIDSGCGCTEVNIPEKELAPGRQGQIEVIYNSAGEVGRQLKTIVIYSNAEKTETRLFIKADVSNDIIELNS